MTPSTFLDCWNSVGINLLLRGFKTTCHCYQTTSHMLVPTHKFSKHAWLQVELRCWGGNEDEPVEMSDVSTALQQSSSLEWSVTKSQYRPIIADSGSVQWIEKLGLNRGKLREQSYIGADANTSTVEGKAKWSYGSYCIPLCVPVCPSPADWFLLPPPLHILLLLVYSTRWRRRNQPRPGEVPVYTVR